MALQKPYNIRQKTSTSDMSKYQMTVGQKKNHSYRKKHLAEPGSGRSCHIQQLLIHTTLKWLTIFKWLFYIICAHCYLFLSRIYNVSLSPYFVPIFGGRSSFICSPDDKGGGRFCRDVPPYQEHGKICTLAADEPIQAGQCVNWNMYYNVCRAGDHNPDLGVINFDNIGYAWITIFQVRNCWYAQKNIWIMSTSVWQFIQRFKIHKTNAFSLAYSAVYLFICLLFCHL